MKKGCKLKIVRIMQRIPADSFVIPKPLFSRIVGNAIATINQITVKIFFSCYHLFVVCIIYYYLFKNLNISLNLIFPSRIKTQSSPDKSIIVDETLEGIITFG